MPTANLAFLEKKNFDAETQLNEISMLIPNRSISSWLLLINFVYNAILLERSNKCLSVNIAVFNWLVAYCLTFRFIWRSHY